MSYVYFIACKETWRWKVGFTTGDPKKRLKALQTGCPSELVLMAFIEADAQEEQSIHRMFDHERVRGEWFEGSDTFVAFVGLTALRVAIKALGEATNPPRWAMTAITSIEDALDIDLADFWKEKLEIRSINNSQSYKWRSIH